MCIMFVWRLSKNGEIYRSKCANKHDRAYDMKKKKNNKSACVKNTFLDEESKTKKSSVGHAVRCMAKKKDKERRP